MPVAYLSFPEEAHGFRAGATIKTCLEAEFLFYARILGYEPADSMEPLVIENFG